MLLYNIANNVHIELRFEKKSYLTKYFSIVNCSLCNFTIKKPGQNQVDHGKFFEVLPHKNFNFTSRKWKKFKKKNREQDFFSFTEILGQDFSKVSGLLFFVSF